MLDNFVNQAWEPTVADLGALPPMLTPHYDKFKTIYQPIRHKVFAHKSTEDDAHAAIHALFDKTVIDACVPRNSGVPSHTDGGGYSSGKTGLERKKAYLTHHREYYAEVLVIKNQNSEPPPSATLI